MSIPSNWIASWREGYFIARQDCVIVREDYIFVREDYVVCEDYIIVRGDYSPNLALLNGVLTSVVIELALKSRISERNSLVAVVAPGCPRLPQARISYVIPQT